MAIHQPHDKFFKRAFRRKEAVADFISVHVDAEELQKLDLNTLELQKDSCML
ncbi:MAG: Rpn family recombination-promoting nuclease/putative transposase [Bacteroidota bacterium]